MRPYLRLVAAAAIALAACGGDDDTGDSADDIAAESVVETIAETVVESVTETTASEAPATTEAPSTSALAETTAPADDDQGDDGASEPLFPDVLAVEATWDDASGTWRFDVTLSSPYDTPERYADAWRVMGPDDTVYGVRELGHDHANEQPFTRSLSGVEIPDEVTTITVEGRDQISGYGGERVTIELVRS